MKKDSVYKEAAEKMEKMLHGFDNLEPNEYEDINKLISSEAIENIVQRMILDRVANYLNTSIHQKIDGKQEFTAYCINTYDEKTGLPRVGVGKTAKLAFIDLANKLIFDEFGFEKPTTEKQNNDESELNSIQKIINGKLQDLSSHNLVDEVNKGIIEGLKYCLEIINTFTKE